MSNFKVNALPIYGRWETTKSYLKLIRVHQWTKNAVVLAALIFSGQLFNIDSVIISLLGAILFSLVSSSVYIFNDVLDAEKDRAHPQKMFRPIASGKISKSSALTLMVLLWLIALPLSILISLKFCGIILLYLVIQIGYCLYLKNKVLLDVLCIASGFVFRAVAGGIILNVIVSPWLILCATLLSLFLALAKRRHELVLLKDSAAEHRLILKEYSTGLLDQLLSLVTASTLMAYSLYTFTSGKPPIFMVTILFVIYGLFRYNYLVYQKALGGSPDKLLLKDTPTLINVLLWAFTSITILYI